MFKGLTEEIKRLNNGVKNVTNCERAKKLKIKLISIGLPMAILGFIGVLLCIIFLIINVTGTFNSFASSSSISLNAGMFIPIFLVIPCSIVGGIGAYIAKLGFGILITGYATNLIDETVGNNCPNCGDIIDDDEEFCSKCGTRLKISCPNCKTINTTKDKFCKKCGKELSK